MLRGEEIKIEIGRVEGGSFIRVTHLPTGRSRSQAPLHGQSPKLVIDRLQKEIEGELRDAGLTQYLVA